MASIQTSPYPLVFPVEPRNGEDPPLDRIKVRVLARALEGMQKEALVTTPATRRSWRMVCDEGPYLNGTDLAPFPLAFFATGLVNAYLAEIVGRAKTMAVPIEKIEKPAGISNPKDFRNEIVNFVLRARANNNGKNPSWTSYEKLREVIEKKMFSNTEELLPVISFNAKASAEDQRKHDSFVERMVSKGYTEKQVRLLCEWYLRVRKSS